MDRERRERERAGANPADEGQETSGSNTSQALTAGCGPQPEEAGRLAALRRYDILDTPEEPGFDALTQLAVRLLDAPIALVCLVDADRLWFKSHRGLPGREFPREGSFCDRVVAQGQPLVVEDVNQDERFAGSPLRHNSLQVRFYAGFPLRTPEGHVLGTLCVMDRRARTASRSDLELLERLADLAVAQLQLRTKILEATEQERRLRAVLETAVDAIITIDETGRIDRINPAGQRMFGYEKGELEGQQVNVLMAPELREAHDRAVESYLRTGEKKIIGMGRELVALHKDGTTFPVDAAITEMRLGDKRMFTGILRDATVRKEAERQLDDYCAHLNDTLQELARSREDLVQVLNQLRVGTLVLAADGLVSFASDTFLGLCGLQTQEAVGRPWEEVLDVNDAVRRAIRELGQLELPKRGRLELCLGSRRRRPRWVELDLRDDPRDRARRIMFLYDVTDLHELKEKLSKQRSDQMIGDSHAMQALYELIARVSAGDWTVLVEGETGAGKELVARAIHSGSPRSKGPFIAVNCAGLTDSLLGSQLFGHRKGSFTGADEDRQGLFEAAAAGTIFLDEIGDISVSVQASLLRVLQEREVTRLGETSPRPVDVRIVAATHRDLRQLAADGKFREDLLYRLRGARLRVPALRERPEDIPLLVAAFLAQQRVTAGKLVTGVSEDGMRLLAAYGWPGNVRELRAAIEYAVIHCRNQLIEVADLPSEIRETGPAAAALGGEDETSRILEALRLAGGNRTHAARLLGMGRATLYRRLAELGLDGRESEGGGPSRGRPGRPRTSGR